jgi:ribose-phosphate pyrophosphokinase
MITKIKYPDNSFYCEVDLEQLVMQDITLRLNTYEDYWFLWQFTETLVHNRIALNSITIPNLLDAQHDNRFKENQSYNITGTVHYLRQLAMIADQVNLFHPHNPEVVKALFPEVNIIDNSEFIKEVIWSINGNYVHEDGYLNLKKDNLILMSSDAGGFKPLMKLVDKLKWQGDTASCAKSRKYVDGKSVLTQLCDREDYQGKDILIADDICVYGGTFVGLSKMLRERNCGKLYLAVSHITVPRITQKLEDAFDGIFTTNSKYESYEGERSNGPVVFTNDGKIKVIKMFDITKIEEK